MEDQAPPQQTRLLSALAATGHREGGAALLVALPREAGIGFASLPRKGVKQVFLSL